MSLLELSDEEFAKKVDHDLRERTFNSITGEWDALHAQLRTEPVRSRWVSALIRSKKDIEWQITNDRAARQEMKITCFYGDDPAGHEEWDRYTARQDRWKANTLRVLKGIERCLAEPQLDRAPANVLSSLDQVLDLLSIGEDETDNQAISMLTDLYEEFKATA